IHIIADNLSAHKTKGVAEFLAHPRQVKLHYTPTYSSWLNQVELWFSKIQRDLIARGVFTSVPDLSRKLLRYIAHYNKAPKAFESRHDFITYITKLGMIRSLFSITISLHCALQLC